VIAKELDTTMALTGVQRAEAIGRDHVLVPQDFEGAWV
jgi:isopentenyl diphosphate isomerase/L-lactate dehydrogenase-like FMN-dependent dehydrogenase